MSIPSWRRSCESTNVDWPLLVLALMTDRSLSARVDERSGSSRSASGRSSRIRALDPPRLPARGTSKSSVVILGAFSFSTMAMRFLKEGAFSLAAALDLGERRISAEIRDLVRRLVGLKGHVWRQRGCC